MMLPEIATLAETLTRDRDFQPHITDRQRIARWFKATETALLRDASAAPSDVALEQGWYCTFCGKLVHPTFFYKDPWNRPGRGMWIEPTHHGCSEERAAIERQVQQRTEVQEVERRERWAKLLEHCGLVGRLADSTFTNFTARQNWRQASELRNHVYKYIHAVLEGTAERNWLILVGDYGTGKSHLAAAAVRVALESGRRAYFRVWPDYLKRLQKSWGPKAAELEADILAELEEGWLVVLDDLDKKHDPSGWARESLFSFLNTRYNRCLPTIITLNTRLTDPDPKAPGRFALEKIVGGAVLDRIIEMATVLDFAGPSHR